MSLETLNSRITSLYRAIHIDDLRENVIRHKIEIAQLKARAEQIRSMASGLGATEIEYDDIARQTRIQETPADALPIWDIEEKKELFLATLSQIAGHDSREAVQVLRQLMKVISREDSRNRNSVIAALAKCKHPDAMKEIRRLSHWWSFGLKSDRETAGRILRA